MKVKRLFASRASDTESWVSRTTVGGPAVAHLAPLNCMRTLWPGARFRVTVRVGRATPLPSVNETSNGVVIVSWPRLATRNA